MAGGDELRFGTSLVSPNVTSVEKEECMVAIYMCQVVKKMTLPEESGVVLRATKFSATRL